MNFILSYIIIINIHIHYKILIYKQLNVFDNLCFILLSRYSKSYQLGWRSHDSSFVSLTVSIFSFFFSFFIRINCLTVFSSLKFTEVSQLEVSVRDCRRLRFLIIDRIRSKLLSSLEPSPTSCKAKTLIILKYLNYNNNNHES